MDIIAEFDVVIIHKFKIENVFPCGHRKSEFYRYIKFLAGQDA